MSKKTRVRFAPSPTGNLHVGSARTALFNWLFARNTGGSFILRIEDTDIKRHQEDMIEKVFGSLRWLGIDWDEGPDVGGDFSPYRQSERQSIYRKKAQDLVKKNHAYLCFCTAEELKAERDRAIGEKGYYIYQRKCLSLDQEEIDQRLKDKQEYAVRFLVPQDKTIEFEDEVYKKISVESKNIEDFIILRSNGLPTYNFSAAIDDALMGITHVIRGEDHLSNTPKQILIYDATGADIPCFTHLPMILGEDGKKLSKRHGSVSIEDYRDQGFLPEAVMNYIALLGWSYDDKTTVFSKDELVKHFSLDNIGKKPARFDYSKLMWLNGNYIRETDDKKIADLISCEVLNIIKDDDTEALVVKEPKDIKDIIEAIIPSIKIRLKTLNEAWSLIRPFFYDIDYSDDIRTYFDKKAIDATKVLDISIEELKKINDSSFLSSEIETTLRSVSDTLGIKFRKTAEVIRLAVWAAKVSPPMFDSIAILGKDRSIERLEEYRDIIS